MDIQSNMLISAFNNMCSMHCLPRNAKHSLIAEGLSMISYNLYIMIESETNSILKVSHFLLGFHVNVASEQETSLTSC